MTGTVERHARDLAAVDLATHNRLVAGFSREARPACEQLIAVLGFDTHPSQIQLAAAISDARLIRGSAAVSDLAGISAVAGHLERILKALHGRRLAWTATLSSTLRGAATELLDLIEAVTDASDADEQRARACASELARYDVSAQRNETDVIIPIARLFHADSGPHILFVPVTPQTEFEQQLRALASRGAPGGAVRTPPARAPELRPQQRRTPTAPRGHELQALLSESVSRMSASFGGTPGEPVPIEQLLYSGPAALERARELARIIRSRGPEHTRELLPELIDLLDLAAAR
jgi:chemotaxis protein histidine kinase CheA